MVFGMIKQHLADGRLLGKYYKFNKRQYHLNFVVRHLMGKQVAKKNGFNEFILWDRKTKDKLYFSQLGFVIEQIKSVYDKYAGFELSPGKNVIDLGAACGEYAYKAIKNGCNVVVAEADPQHYDFLVRNLKEFTNVQFIFGFIGNRNDCIPLDDIDHGFKSIDILKIDVEGDELNVLKTGNKTLKITKNIIMEVHSDALRRDCEKHLVDRGFTVEHPKDPDLMIARK